VKYKPPNQAITYFSLAWQSEYMLRELEGPETRRDGGLYSQVVMQFARQWFLGVRADLLGIPRSSVQNRVTRASASLTYATSEFARIRAYVEREWNDQAGLSPQDNTAAYLQIELAIGAHGAHAF
jgi:hypothetical protein